MGQCNRDGGTVMVNFSTITVPLALLGITVLSPQEVTIIFQECEVKVSKELSMFVLYQQLLG